MPPKEGERGKDQHLAVETLPPRVILCTRKMKAVGKRWLSWLRAVEAGRSVKGECGVFSPSSATLIAAHTKNLFSSQGEISKSSGAGGCRQDGPWTDSWGTQNRMSHMQVCFAPVCSLRWQNHIHVQNITAMEINRVLFEGGYCKISNALLSRPRVSKLL